MNVVPLTDDIFFIVIPNNFYSKEKTTIIKKIKDFILTYNRWYHFLDTGFYQVKVGFNKIVGTILEVEKLDDFDFGEDSIDLRIIITGEVDIGYSFDDFEFPLEECYLYHGKIYLLSEEVIEKNFYHIIEHGNIVLKDELKKVKTEGIFVKI